jgi:nucleotidyltransferase/DNA polymerase involved in DNA repair
MSEPLAVQQWNMVIAINYAARAKPFQIKRGMSAVECRKRCPQIHLVHVEVLDTNNPTGSAEPSSSSRPDNISKASLERYRRASEEIMAVLSRYVPVCERASIDEAYLDLTELAASRETLNNIDFETLDNDAVLNTIPPFGLSVQTSRVERRYAVGAVIVSEIRAAVMQELGFSVSAGIAGNKMIAKQASAAFKPNRQTVVPPAASLSMISGLRIKDVRGLGGKFGYEVSEKLDVQTLGEIREKFSFQDLSKELGPKCASWLHNVCQGNDEEPVKCNLIPKSILAFKSFETIDSVEEVERWLDLLCGDVLNRMKGDMLANKRRPKGMTVWHKAGAVAGSHKNSGVDSTRSGPLPVPMIQNFRSARLTDDTVENMELVSSLLPGLKDFVKAALCLLSRVPGSVVPCCRLGVGVSDFIDIPQLRATNVIGALDSFFKLKPSSSTAPPVDIIDLSPAESDDDDQDVYDILPKRNSEVRCQQDAPSGVSRVLASSTVGSCFTFGTSSSSATAQVSSSVSLTSDGEALATISIPSGSVTHCVKCGAVLGNSDRDIQIHMDEHVAAEFDAEWNHNAVSGKRKLQGGGDSKQSSTSPSKSNKKTKESASTSNYSSKHNTLDSFFKRKS